MSGDPWSILLMGIGIGMIICGLSTLIGIVIQIFRDR